MYVAMFYVHIRPDLIYNVDNLCVLVQKQFHLCCMTFNACWFQGLSWTSSWRNTDQIINDAVRQVESKENTHDRDCLMRHTVKEIQAGKIPSTSPFLLVMQTAQQRGLLVKYDNTVMLMDAIYKTCKYNFPCFFLTVKTSISIGQVFATIFLEFETELYSLLDGCY